MNLSASSAKPDDPTYFLEGVIHDKSEMADFEGPLSLILLLLSKNKIEIRDIKISEILDQYLEYLNAMEKLDLEIASEFVQMASYLLYIKTRMLLTEEKEVTELEQLIASLEQRKPPKLSQPALEVLAIVAYFQPVTRAYIDQVRGVDSAYTVTTLLERGLIEACGKLDAPGRPSLYRTSALFLRTMGMQSLDELPVLPDLSSDEGAEKLEQAISELRGRGEQMELTDTEEKPTGE